MGWKGRVAGALVAGALAGLVGVFGGALGTILPWFVWVVLSVVAAGLLLPWSQPKGGQETLLQETGKLKRVFGELGARTAELEQLEREVEEGGSLGDAELARRRDRLQELKELPEEVAAQLRELLFERERRLRPVLLLLLIIAACGGATAAVRLAKIFHG